MGGAAPLDPEVALPSPLPPPLEQFTQVLPLSNCEGQEFKFWSVASSHRFAYLPSTLAVATRNIQQYLNKSYLHGIKGAQFYC